MQNTFHSSSGNLKVVLSARNVISTNFLKIIRNKRARFLFDLQLQVKKTITILIFAIKKNKGLRNEEKFNKFIESIQNIRNKSKTEFNLNLQSYQTIVSPPPVETTESDEQKEKKATKNTHNTSYDSCEYLKPTETPKKERPYHLRNDSREDFKFTHLAKQKTENQIKNHLRNSMINLKHEIKSKHLVKFFTKNPAIHPDHLAQPKFVAVDQNQPESNRTTPRIEKKLRSVEKDPFNLDNKQKLIHSISQNVTNLRQNNTVQSPRLQLGVNVSDSNNNTINNKATHNNNLLDSSQSPTNLSSSRQVLSPSPKRSNSGRKKAEKRRKPNLQIDELLGPLNLKNPMSPSPAERLDSSVTSLYKQLRQLNGRSDHRDHSPGFNIFDKTQLQRRDLRKGLQEEERLENERKKGNELVMGMPAKHYRVANEGIEILDKYGVSLESTVSLSKAKNKLLELKVNHYKELANQPLDSTQPYMSANGKFVKNKKMIVNGYNILDKHCKELVKSNKKVQNLVTKRFGMLSTGLEQMNSELNAFDVMLENELRKDLLNELSSGQNQFLLGREARIEQKKKEEKENYKKERRKREEQEKKLAKGDRGGKSEEAKRKEKSDAKEDEKKGAKGEDANRKKSSVPRLNQKVDVQKDMKVDRKSSDLRLTKREDTKKDAKGERKSSAPRKSKTLRSFHIRS